MSRGDSFSASNDILILHVYQRGGTTDASFKVGKQPGRAAAFSRCGGAQSKGRRPDRNPDRWNVRVRGEPGPQAGTRARTASAAATILARGLHVRSPRGE